jgi:phosphatidylserine/phosphatidylglycerophosphate/cardiolipin synthase-like enzyme
MTSIDGMVGRLDSILGQGIESAICAHHARRLGRIGHSEAMQPPEDGSLWAAGHPPPREGCRLEVLVDGDHALAAIARELAGARSHVHIAGWHLDPDFGLTREDGAPRLRDLLAELSERAGVRVLLWAGAPLRVFTPARGEVRAARERLVRGTRIRCALDSRERPMHCHHEKLVIVDDRVAFVGGIDLTSLGGDRHDTREHPMRSSLGWHDAVCRLEGPAVADVAAHFATRWREADGETIAPSPPPDAAGDHVVQVLRTVPERIYARLPRGDFRILEAYTRALRSARSLVYIENQFLWAPHITRILARKLQDPPSPDFRLVVLLPARPNNGADSTRGQLGVLAAADDGAGRFLAATVTSLTGALRGPLYVHAKVAVVDDRWLTVGSANLNDHSLFNDTEMNLLTCDPDLARETRLALWAEHLERPVEELQDDPARVVDELWRPTAAEQLRRRRADEPATHRLLELPGVSRRSMALLGPLDGLLVDG